MTRKIFLIGCLLCALSSVSQSRTSLDCLNREFHILAHVVTDSHYTPALNFADVQSAIDSLNKYWSPICVKFNLCEYRLDSNYNFSAWNKDTMEAEYIALNYQQRVINIIIVDTILRPARAGGYATLGGISMRTGDPVIVVSKFGYKIWIHEMGHYFGLKHPFESTLANANNANCATLDDGLCDTPPDPDPEGLAHSNCIYNGQFKDVNGKYYNPLVENFMSYYGMLLNDAFINSGCGKSFTHNQYERMVKTYKLDTEAKF